MSSLKDRFRRKRGKPAGKSHDREKRGTAGKSAAKEVASPRDEEKPLTSEKSQRLDFATLGDHPVVDAERNEQAHARTPSRAPLPTASPDGPASEKRADRLRERLPTPSP